MSIAAAPAPSTTTARATSTAVTFAPSIDDALALSQPIKAHTLAPQPPAPLPSIIPAHQIPTQPPLSPHSPPLASTTHQILIQPPPLLHVPSPLPSLPPCRSL
ncbi:unnamed protein product [Cuscuta europaea]|uniref:Uncharacterized protein n=1 Tax=Cuscuta europaea TaxID=41803 RepID=A0A9P0YFC8_CUSEU|nr:unnamed protein product [Cuscuta europaea]